MKKLTLEQWAIYLPYNPIMIGENPYDGGNPTQGVLVGVDSLSIASQAQVELRTTGGYFSCSLSKCKLFARPLSDLTKPITVKGYNDGKEFVPIVELAKINDPYLPEDGMHTTTDNWGELSTVCCENMQHNVNYIVKTSNMGNLVYEFSYWEVMQRFALKDTTRSLVLGVARQYEMFQLLAKWHFWIYDQEAFKTGEIIDINTLK